MINAKEASEKLANMNPEERFEIIKNRVSESTKNAIDTKVREAIAWYKRKVDITLGAQVCIDPDEDIRAFLLALGYSNVKVTSDFPAYCETYEGKTNIKFSIP